MATINENKIAQRSLAVVTGASSGIGFELAKIFGRNGYDLVIVAENEKIFSAKSRIEEATGVEVFAYQTDLTNYSDVEEFYGFIAHINRPIAAIALNAGVGVGGNFAKQTSLEEELNMINLNVVSTVHLAKRVIKKMLKDGGGKVLFTSAIASLMPGPFEAVYAASKAFVQSFAIALRNELNDTGVTITVLMPGATDTDFFHRAGMDNTKIGQAKKDDPALVARQGFDALMAGKDHVIAGSIKNNIQGGLTKIISETVAAKIHRQQTEPQSEKH
jgi:uncharacterized protein